MVEDARFEEVYRAHGPAVLRYCTYSAGSRSIAEDLAAETFARYLEKGANVPAEKTEAWLIRVARNLCASHHRTLVRGRALDARIADSAPAVADGWEDPGSWEYVRVLKESERLVVYLHLYEERTFGEIARLLGKSQSAVKMTFYRAVERLRARMQRDGFGSVTPLAGGAENG